MDNPDNPPDVIVIPHRPSRFPVRIALPVVVLLVAMFGAALRAASPDWRGLWQEAGERTRTFFAVKPKAEPPKARKPVPALARADTHRPVATAEVPKPDPAPRPKDDTAWDAIKRDAEKAQAERDEAEKLKEQAAEGLAKNPPPPSFRRGRVVRNPAVVAEMQRRRVEMIRHLDAMMANPPRELNEFFRQQERMMGDMARHRGFAAPPPGFGNFDPPLPGMDRFIAPMPGPPRIREDAGEEVRNGVRLTWRTRVFEIDRRKVKGR